MTPSHSPDYAGCRGEGRPVRRRTRTFRPNYLSFAATYQCNLTCAHCCVPIEWPDRLDITTSLRFLEDAHAQGIGTLGFTGGEPFLYAEFLHKVCRRAAELGFRFDKIMTNGVWHRDADQLREVLSGLAAAGFTGKLGISVDKFHGMHTARAAEFCRVAREAFNRDNIVSLSYASRRPDLGLEPVQDLARELDGVIDWSPVLHRYMLVARDLTLTLNWNHLAPVERAEKLTGGWDGSWFEEDYCEGPGQALIVTPRGEVKPCCGFASDLDQLTIGNIYRDSVRTIIRRARRHPYVGKVFREGLTAIRDEVLARDPDALPGATSNHCFFCWYVLTKSLVNVPSAAGGNALTDRMSLPMVGEPLRSQSANGETVTTLLMVFDGRTVHVGRDLPPTERGEVFLISIAGPRAIERPPERMPWAEYQAWVDRLRDKGCTLTTNRFSPCQRKN